MDTRPRAGPIARIAGGTRVVLPEPGGATSTSDRPASRSMISGRLESIGSWSIGCSFGAARRDDRRAMRTRRTRRQRSVPVSIGLLIRRSAGVALVKSRVGRTAWASPVCCTDRRGCFARLRTFALVLTGLHLARRDGNEMAVDELVERPARRQRY